MLGAAGGGWVAGYAENEAAKPSRPGLGSRRLHHHHRPRSVLAGVGTGIVAASRSGSEERFTLVSVI